MPGRPRRHRPEIPDLRHLVVACGWLGVTTVLSAGLATAGLMVFGALAVLAGGCGAAGHLWWYYGRRGDVPPSGSVACGHTEKMFRITFLFSDVSRRRILVDALVSVESEPTTHSVPEPVSLLVARPRSVAYDLLLVRFIEECRQNGSLVELVLADPAGRRAKLHRGDTIVEINFVQPLARTAP